MARGPASIRRVPQRAASLLLFVASGLVAIAGMVIGVNIKGLSDTRQPLFDGIAAVCGPHTFGQSFIATESNLDRIDLWLAWSQPQQLIEPTATTVPAPTAAPMTDRHSAESHRYRLFLPSISRPPDGLGFSTGYYALNADGCELTSPGDMRAVVVSLKQDPASSEVIAAETFRLDQVADPATAVQALYDSRSFAFDPIPDSAGRVFYLSIGAPGASASAPLLARYHRGNVYADGIRYEDGASVSGDLAFKLHYAAAPMGDLWLLLHRLTQNRPAPFAWPWLYFLLLAAYVGCVALVIKALGQYLGSSGD